VKKPHFAVLSHLTYTIENPSAIFQTVSEEAFYELRL
jgi:hypothetical protein